MDSIAIAAEHPLIELNSTGKPSIVPSLRHITNGDSSVDLIQPTVLLDFKRSLSQ
jgi:hypothetical protein